MSMRERKYMTSTFFETVESCPVLRGPSPSKRPSTRICSSRQCLRKSLVQDYVVQGDEEFLGFLHQDETAIRWLP